MKLGQPQGVAGRRKIDGLRAGLRAFVEAGHGEAAAVGPARTEIHCGAQTITEEKVRGVALVIIGRKGEIVEGIAQLRERVGVGDPAGDTVRGAALEKNSDATSIPSYGIVIARRKVTTQDAR